MAKFVYYWKTPDNARHEGEIDAPDREVAFARLRERGIRAIKVEPKGWETGHGYRGVRKRAVAACLIAAVAVTGVVAFWGGTRSAAPGEGVVVIDTPQGPVTSQVAQPLARQQIPGDRFRLTHLPTNLFNSAAEMMLARYAEPGRPFGDVPFVATNEFAAALKEPIRIASNEFTEYVDLKRIVTGMKREMKAYLAGGGTVEQYLAELTKRQRLEIAYREKAERRLEELLPAKPAAKTGGASSSDALSAAYAYWLKANAQLKSMGIYELPLPDELRTYQQTVDLDAGDKE